MISVVIPTYRKPRLLERTLVAIEEQWNDVGERGEVVVVDDGSGDESPDVIASFRGRLPIREASPAHNEGRAKARNRGWRAAHGESVLFLDDDIVLEPGALLAHLRAQERRPAAYLGEVRSDPTIVDSSLFEYLDTRGIAKREPGAVVPSRYFLTQNASVPRAALERIGGFDEEFSSYGFEDMELAFRLEDLAGLSFFRLDGASGLHVHHHTLTEYLEKKRLCGRQSLPQIARLHPRRIAEMQLDVVPGLAAPTTPGRRALRATIALSRALGLPKLIAPLLPRWTGAAGRVLRHRLYDYLVLCCYADGCMAARSGR